jgi:hypothetical protein
MKTRTLPLLAAVLMLGAGASWLRADDHWGKAADNHIYGQKLVNELMAEHPELVVVGLHAVPPGAKDEIMFATNLDRVGKQDDDDDKGVANEHKIVMAPNMTDPHKFEIQIPLLDAAGHYIGATGLVFKYTAGDDVVALLSKALAIRDGLAQKTPNLAALFAPTS